MIFLSLIANLWAADIDYVNIQKGEEAPISGKLLSEEALAKIIAQHESELKELQVKNQYELTKQSDELSLKYDLYEMRCEENIIMYKQMIDIRDTEIKKQSRKDWIQRWAFFGGYVLGAAMTIGIVHSVNQI